MTNAFDHVRVVAQLTWQNNVIQNVWHFRVSDVGTTTSELETLTDISYAMDNMYLNIQSNISDEVTFDSIYGYNETLDIPMGTVPWPVLVAGTNIAAPLPEACSVMMRIPTGLPRREGRKYFGLFTEGANDPGAIISPGPIANLANLFALFSYSGVLPTYGVQLQGRVKTVQFGVAVYVPTPTFLINTQWDYQRRRKAGVGI